MRLSTVIVRKDAAAVVKTQDHDLVDLVVNEVSLVTEPAILTDAESKNHAGFQVVKLDVPEEERIATAFGKAFEPRAEEDFDSVRKRLADVVRKKLLAETGDTETYYMSALKIWKDRALMGFWWEDDAPTLAAEQRVAYYHAYYTQDPSTKDFTVTRIAPLLVTMTEATPQEAADSAAADAAEDAAELEPVMESAPEVAPVADPPVASEVAPEAGSTVEQSTPEPEAAAPEADPPAAPEQRVAIQDVVAKLAAAGTAFVLKVVDGQMLLEVGAATEAVVKTAEPAPDVAALRIEKLALEKERDELRQRVAKSNADDPLLASEVNRTSEAKAADTYFGRVVAAGIAQTIIV